MPKTTWSLADSRRVVHEGWEIFECGGDHPPYELQKIDDEDRFTTDQEAWVYVMARALLGSGPHCRALNFLAEASPAELNLIRKYRDEVGLRDFLLPGDLVWWKQTESGGGGSGHRPNPTRQLPAVVRRLGRRVQIAVNDPRTYPRETWVDREKVTRRD